MTDTDTLREQIARAFYENRVAAIDSDREREFWPAWEDHEKADADEWREAADAVLAVVQPAIREAQAEAWTDCVTEASALGWLFPAPARHMLDRNPYERSTDA